MESLQAEKSQEIASDPKKSSAGSSKFSFSLPSKSSSAKPKRRQSDHKDSLDKEDEKPEFLEEFDPNKPAGKKLKVIPKLENSWRPERKMKNIQMTESELQFEQEGEAGERGTESKVEYGLNIRTHVSDSMEIEQNNKEGLGFVNFEEAERQRLRDSIKELPEEASLEAYDSLPVEDFGAALLRGLGWSEGEGIGRSKEIVKPVEYVKRVGREGLGATPAPPEEKSKRPLKPGESREGRKDLVAASGPDGRSRNVVSVGERLVERQRKGVAVGKVMFVFEGRHVGLRGEVVKILGGSDESSSDDARVVLRLLKSEENVVVGVSEVVDVGSVEEEECLRRLKEMRMNGNGHGRDRTSRKDKEEDIGEWNKDRYRNSDSHSGDEKRDRRGDYRSRDEKRNDSGRRERERDFREPRSRDHVKSGYGDSRDVKRHGMRQDDPGWQSRQLEANRSKGHHSSNSLLGQDSRKGYYDDLKGDGRRDIYHDEDTNKTDVQEEQRNLRDMSRKNEISTGRKEVKAVKMIGTSYDDSKVPYWLTNHIRVRIVSKDFKGGKLYLKKGRVIDVVDPTTCDLLMDENGVVVQGVKQDMLETALPKKGGLIMVVEGKHRGIIGKLLERDSDKGVGLVQKEDTLEMLKLSLDHIAEFVGDPGEIGY